MRYFIAALIITTTIFSSVLYISCTKRCGSKSCQNGGKCDGDACTCPTGYSGKTCGTGWNDVFIGLYKCSRNTCSPSVAGDTAWVSSITRSTDGATISISNFDNSNRIIIAKVDTFHKVTISSVPPAYGVTANGNYVNGRIDLSYTTITSGGISGYNCKMIFIKQ